MRTCSIGTVVALPLLGEILLHDQETAARRTRVFEAVNTILSSVLISQINTIPV